MLSIRPTTPEDDDALWPMLEPVFRAGETMCVPRDIDRAGALDHWGGHGHETFVAEDEEGRPVGTSYLCANQRGGGDHVANAGFIVAPGVGGKGVARRLLDHALGRARARGFRAMQFNFVVSTNARAIAIWESYDFRVVGRLPGAFHHPAEGYVDALVMYRTL